MSWGVRFPNITAPTEAGQLQQVKSYLHQLAEQLNWALRTLESGNSSSVVDTNGNAVSGTSESEKAATTFNQIKSLIIKSADIVNAYYEKIDELLKLSGDYTASSDFGKFSEKTNQVINANSANITQLFTNTQEISATLAGLEDSIITVNAYLKTGLLDYADSGAPVYGLEIGQTTTGDDGVDTFTKFSRFTADRLSFYDAHDIEVAYVSDYKLVITNAEIKGTLKLGEYEIDTTDGLAFKYVGRG